jgi:hypothetical protein
VSSIDEAPWTRQQRALLAKTRTPIWRSGFPLFVVGFRPRRSATQALEVLCVNGARGGSDVLDADVKNYFGDPSLREALLRPRAHDHAALATLAARVREGGARCACRR